MTILKHRVATWVCVHFSRLLSTSDTPCVVTSFWLWRHWVMGAQIVGLRFDLRSSISERNLEDIVFWGWWNQPSSCHISGQVPSNCKVVSSCQHLLAERPRYPFVRYTSGSSIAPCGLVDVLRDIPDTICIFGHCFILKFQVYASDLPSWSCRNWWILSLDLALFNQGDPVFWHCQSATDLREGFLRNLHTICGINSVGPSLCHWDLIALRLGTVVTVRFGGRSSPGTIRNEFGGPLTYDLTTCLQPAVETVRDERRFCRISPGHSGPCVTN